MIGTSIPLLISSAFICALFGTILWVCGGSTCFFLKSGIGVGSSVTIGWVFSVWLITYGLVGLSLGLIWLICKARLIPPNACLAAFAMCMLVYLLMQTWYAVFFCTRLTVFAGVLLFLSTVICAWIIFITRRSFILLTLILVIVDTVQIYFLYFTFS